MYAVCTGRSPFRASTIIDAIRRVCDDTPRPIQEVNPEIPSWLADIVNRLLAKEPSDRFDSAAQVGECLAEYLAQVQQPAQFPVPAKLAGKHVERRSARPRRRLWPVLAALMMLALVVIVPVFLRPGKQDSPLLTRESPQESLHGR